MLRKNRFSRHRRQTLKASNTATDHHKATERPPEIAQSPHKQQNPIGFSHHFHHFRAKISEISANIPHSLTRSRIFLIFLPVFSLSIRSSVYLHANQSSYRSTSGVPTAYFYGSLTNYRRSKIIYISFVLWGDYRGGIIGKGVWGETIKGGPSRGEQGGSKGDFFACCAVCCQIVGSWHRVTVCARRPAPCRTTRTRAIK